jgi:hypothetical protein
MSPFLPFIRMQFAFIIYLSALSACMFVSAQQLNASISVAQTHVLPAQGRTWPLPGWPALPNLADWNFHLTGGRDALILIESITLTGDNSDAGMTAGLLQVYAGVGDRLIPNAFAGQKVSELTLNSPSTLPLTQANGPTYNNDTGRIPFWVNIPAEHVLTGLQVIVQCTAGPCAGQTSDRINITVGLSIEYTMRTLPVYMFNITEQIAPLSQYAIPTQQVQDEYYAKHPFSLLNITNASRGKFVMPFVLISPSNQGVTGPAFRIYQQAEQKDGFQIISAAYTLISRIRGANGDWGTCSHDYATMLIGTPNGKGINSPGGGLGGNSICSGDKEYSGIFIHEMGHAFGMAHAGDAYNAGNYPYIGGSLKGSAWGYDQKRNIFLPSFIPSSSNNFHNCAANVNRQLDSYGRCVKQDPMQGGAGDQAFGDQFTEFSDFNSGAIQRYFENGCVMNDKQSTTGFSKYDRSQKKRVEWHATTTDNGLYGFLNGFPIQRDVSIYTIIFTAGILIQDTFNETTLDPSLTQPVYTYKDTITYDPLVTIFYPPMHAIGNLIQLIDPQIPQQLNTIRLNTGPNPWYCQGSGCDYTLRITYIDGTNFTRVIQGGFQGWFANGKISVNAINPNHGDSWKIWGMNIPGEKLIHKMELLETPLVYLGYPKNPKVISFMIVNPLPSDQSDSETSTTNSSSSSTGGSTGSDDPGRPLDSAAATYKHVHMPAVLLAGLATAATFMSA